MFRPGYLGGQPAMYDGPPPMFPPGGAAPGGSAPPFPGPAQSYYGSNMPQSYGGPNQMPGFEYQSRGNEFMSGYPRSIIVERSGDDTAKVDQADLRKSLINFLEADDDIGTASAANQKLRDMMKELADVAAMEAASLAATTAADRVARQAYLERATLIPPNESLSITDLNLVENFVRNPGTGPFLLLFMILGYGGLIEEKSESAKERDTSAKDKSWVKERLTTAFKMKDKAGISFEAMYKFLSESREQAPASNAVSNAEEQLKGLAAGTAASDALEKIQEMEISSPWHIAFLPFSMLLVQFSYIFFIFYEAWNGYVGGTCPGYLAWTSSPGIDAFPAGANAPARVLMGFIAAFFCVRVLQQLVLFAHALEGQHTDGGLKTETDSAFRFGFLPTIQTWAAICKRSEDMITNTLSNLPAGGNKVSKDDDFEKGIKAYLGIIHENIRNLTEMAYGTELKRVQSVEKRLTDLELTLYTQGYLTEVGLREVQTRAEVRSKDSHRPVTKRNPDLMGWRNVKWSWILPFYIADCIVQLTLLICVFLVNLYIVFIDGVSARDMVLNVVLLDFIYEQLPKFKLHVFRSDKAKALLRTLKIAHNDPPRWTLWKMQCRFAKSVGLQLIVACSFLAFLITLAMVMYGPICKPGPSTAGTLPAVKSGR